MRFFLLAVSDKELLSNKEILDPQISGTFYFIKFIFLLSSLIFSLILVIIWLKFELKNKDEIGKWQSYLKWLRNYLFLKNPKSHFEKIKKTFHYNPILALREINNFLDFVLTTFGYEGNLEEKINKANPSIFSNPEDLKKAILAWRLIEERLKESENVNLNQNDYLLLFHTYEIALKDLNIISSEDFLVKNLEQLG